MMADLPFWVAVPVAVLVVLGSTLALIGALGLVRLKTFYERLHAPSLITSWGTGTIVFASILLFSYQRGGAVLHELLIGIFVMVTVPITTMILARASLNRDRIDGLLDSPEFALAAPAAPAQEPTEQPASEPATETVTDTVAEAVTETAPDKADAQTSEQTTGAKAPPSPSASPSAGA